MTGHERHYGFEGEPPRGGGHDRTVAATLIVWGVVALGLW